jgi:hypothetical protein
MTEPRDDEIDDATPDDDEGNTSLPAEPDEPEDDAATSPEPPTEPAP